MPRDVPLVKTIEELTSDWLGEALGREVGGFEVERIGTGQMSLSYRVTLDAADSVVVKLSATDPTSRGTGLGLGIYEREVRFYRELAPHIGAAALAECHAAAIDSTGEWFTLVLEDITPATQGDQIAGCTPEEARLALTALAEIHAPLLADPGRADTAWLERESPLDQALMSQLLPAFVERYGERVTPEHREVCERLVASLDGFNAEEPHPKGLIHGDYRLDNMLFGAGDAVRPFAVVDWQTVGWGAAMTDASYFLGSGLTVEDRRAHEESLLREYHAALEAKGAGLDWQTCWDGYRRQAFVGILMVVAPAMIVERTERGDEMFLTSLERFAQQVLDLEALELLPAPGTNRPAPLRPDPADEGRHPPGPEELWNESWYFDAISEDRSLGAWVRLGLYPNLGVSWVTAFICGPQRKPVAVIDFAAPLPAEDTLAVETGQVELALDCAAPLERYAVVLDAIGEQHADAAAFLRGEPGEPVRVGIHLVWATEGEPYAYRMATRYEIPCRVAGRVRIGDERLELRGLGQRDHSWGPRDWWAAEWMWSAGHLDDGTAFHGVEFRLPDAPRLGVGYVQAGGDVAELERVAASETVGDDGLIERARVAYGDGLELDVEPLAFGPLRLVAPDGRSTNFPRAMCRVTAHDGRTGAAWVEWNLNRSL